MATPSQFKALKKYVREAKKLLKSQPGAAYYTLLYAVQEAMGIDAQSPEAKNFIGALMDDMGVIKSNPNCPSLDKEVQKAEIEELALRIFTMADEVDKRGEATKKTAQIFSSSYVLCEVLKQFGERDHEIVTKGKYALMKTGSILKAIRDGVKPQAGIPEGKRSKGSRESDELPDPNSIGMGSIVEENGKNYTDATDGINNCDHLGVEDGRDNNMSFGVPAPVSQDDTVGIQPEANFPTNEPSFFHATGAAQPRVPSHVQSNVTLEELVNVCSGVEETISAVACSLRLKDVAVAAGTIKQFIETLTPYNQGGNWKPVSIPRQSKTEICAAVEVKMKHVVSALRFQDVYAALAILQHSAEALAPFCPAPERVNFI